MAKTRKTEADGPCTNPYADTVGFVVGDVVQLKSGSPSMTVVGVEGNKVETAWFCQGPHGSWVPSSAWQPAGALKRVASPA